MTSQSRRNHDRWSWKEEGICDRGRSTTEDSAVGRWEGPFWALPDLTRLLKYSEQGLKVEATTL